MSLEVGGIPRHVPADPPGFSKVELAARTKHLKELRRDYPDVPDGWLEMAYDWHHRTPQEEIDRIIESGEWEAPGKFSNEKGGVLQSVVIEPPPEQLDDPPPLLDEGPATAPAADA